MTYAFTQDVPTDAAFNKRITDALGPEPPEGLLVHLAMELPEGGLRFVDVWESKEASDRFIEERLEPIVKGVLAEAFGENVPPAPERNPISVVHIWGNL